MSEPNYGIRVRKPANPKLVQALEQLRGEFSVMELVVVAGVSFHQAQNFVHKRFYRGQLHRVGKGIYQTINQTPL